MRLPSNEPKDITNSFRLEEHHVEYLKTMAKHLNINKSVLIRKLIEDEYNRVIFKVKS